MEGVRISHATPIDILMQQDFQIKVNDKSFDILPPKPGMIPNVFVYRNIIFLYAYEIS